MKGNLDFPGAIIKATKNPNLTNILEDCKKFHGYFPYNDTSNIYFNNGTFLLALIDEYSYEDVRLWLEWCWDQMHWDRPFNYMWEYLFNTITKINKGDI